MSVRMKRLVASVLAAWLLIFSAVGYAAVYSAQIECETQCADTGNTGPGGVDRAKCTHGCASHLFGHTAGTAECCVLHVYAPSIQSSLNVLLGVRNVIPQPDPFSPPPEFSLA
jgi:hypothetical protein